MQQEKILPWKSWEVVKLIGRGTYGDVYEIQKREAQYVTRAALKVIHVSLDEQKKRELESEKISLASYLQETQSNIISEIARHTPFIHARRENKDSGLRAAGRAFLFFFS